MEKEDNVAGFLGVQLDVDHNNSTVELTQCGLIGRIIYVMGLDDSTSFKTPVEYGALPKDENSDSCNSTFNYSSIIGMLLYLQHNSRPDLAFAVSQCARYTFYPKLSHEKALKSIGRYLQGTRDKGLLIKTTEMVQV